MLTYLREKGYHVSNVEHNIAYASSGLSVYTIALISPQIKGQKSASHKVLCQMVSELEYVNHVEVQM